MHRSKQLCLYLVISILALAGTPRLGRASTEAFTNSTQLDLTNRTVLAAVDFHYFGNQNVPYKVMTGWVAAPNSTGGPIQNVKFDIISLDFGNVANLALNTGGGNEMTTHWNLIGSRKQYFDTITGTGADQGEAQALANIFEGLSDGQSKNLDFLFPSYPSTAVNVQVIGGSAGNGGDPSWNGQLQIRRDGAGGVILDSSYTAVSDANHPAVISFNTVTDASGALILNFTASGGQVGVAGIIVTLPPMPELDEKFPLIINSNATAVLTSGATLNGYLSSTGLDANASAWVFWGTNDPGPVISGWGHSNAFPTPAVVGPLSTNVSLSGEPATYYYRFYATNLYGESWASPAQVFGLPIVDNAGGATNVKASSATLQGSVRGCPAPVVAYIYWGAIDGGTNLGVWRAQNEILIGPGTNWSFSTSITVPSETTNYYRCFASNSYGQAWAPYSVAFTSLVAVLPQIDQFSVVDRPTRQVFNIVFDGNSWVAGSGSEGGESRYFPSQAQALLQAQGKTVNIRNYGVAGQTIDDMQSDAVTQIDPNHTTYDILVGLELVNQWGGSTTYSKEAIYAKYKQYFLDRKAAGFAYVFACTPHNQAYYSRIAGGDWATVRAYFVSQMKAEFPSLGIGVIDCGSAPELSDYNNTTYFTTDKIHLNNAGQGVQAQYTCDALITNCGAQASDVILSLVATIGWSYGLQQTPTLVPPAWTNVVPHTNLTGLGTMAITNSIGTNETMFYRVIAFESD